MSSNQVKVGIVGLGRWAKVLARAAQATDALRIVAGYSRTAEKRSEFQKEFGVAAMPDLEMACTIARAARPGIAEAASKDLSHALLNGEFPEGSPFSDPDSLECQEATDSDTDPSSIGSVGAPDLVGGAVPVVEDLRQGQELLQELGLTGAAEQVPAPGAVEGAKVDMNVVAMAVMMLYEALLAANGGSVADQNLSAAVNKAEPQVRDAASQAGQSLKDAGQAAKAKATGSSS